jgi:arginine deiminase
MLNHGVQRLTPPAGSYRLGVYADAEYQPCRDVVLCRAGGAAPQAITQHALLEQALKANRVNCHFLEPRADAPFQCYTRDSSVVTPWGLLIARMGLSERRVEPGSVRLFAHQHHLPVWREVERGTLEGGDVILLRPGLAVVGCNGDRTTSEAASDVATWFRREGWTCRVVRYPPSYRHLDLVVGVLDASNLLCHLDALGADDVHWLRQLGYALHHVEVPEVWRMGCNILNLGNRTIVAAQECPEANSRMQALGFRVVELDVSCFADDLGGVHCLTQCLHREASGIASKLQASGMD